jgi:hypothetical protein
MPRGLAPQRMWIFPIFRRFDAANPLILLTLEIGKINRFTGSQDEGGGGLTWWAGLE